MVMGAFFKILSRSRPPPFIIRRLGLSTTATSVVCRSSPWLMLPSSAVADKYTRDVEVRSMDYSFYRLSDKQTISLCNKGNSSLTKYVPDPFCFGSSSGWLLYCDPRDFSLYLVNPLCPIPRRVCLPYLVDHDDDDAHFEIDKLVIDKFSISRFMGKDSHDWLIVIIIQKQLKFWTIRTCSEHFIKLDHSSEVIDVIYSSKDQLFYTLNSNYEIETWNIKEEIGIENIKEEGDNDNDNDDDDDDDDDDKTPLIIPKRKSYHPTLITNHHPEFEECLCSNYLVESKGDILLVLRYFCSKNTNNNKSKTRRFDVYKLNEAKDSWDQLRSLGDRVLFLGMNEPFSLSSSDFPELKPNSVYFTGPAAKEGKYSASDWGIYDLNDHTVTCHYPCDFTLKIRPPPIWIRTDSNSC